MKIVSDWSTLPQAGKSRSKVHTSSTNKSTSKPDTPQMGTPFSDIIDIMTLSKHRFKTYASHYKIESKNMPCQQHKAATTRRFAVDRLKDRDVASPYYDELESELQDLQTQPLSLDEKCNKLDEPTQREATNTIGYTRKQANKSGLTRSVYR
jgi:hypothetical protein